MSDIFTPATGADTREAKLEELRREAAQEGHIARAGIRAAGAPFPKNSRASAETGYHGVPLLKTPAWTWEVPIYFFTGGIAGAAAILGGVSRWTGADPRLVRDARALAVIAGGVSPPLLIADLGMPSRFLNMLRVFKIQSPMSVGSWTLVVFSSSSAGVAFLDFVKRNQRSTRLLRVVESAAEFISVVSGAALATYTGVLIGATAIPVWNKNVGALPIHFAASGMGSAASILELRGHETPALNAIAMAAAATETAIGVSIELRKDRVLKPLKTGRSGWLTRIGGFLSGPLPLALRLLSLAASGRNKNALRKSAAAAAVAGSLVTRFAWVQAGHASAGDPSIPLELPESSTKD